MPRPARLVPFDAAMTAVPDGPSRIVLPGGELDLHVRRSPRARTLRLTVHPERGVVLSMPATRAWAGRAGAGRARAFLVEREGWIRRHLDRFGAERRQLAGRPGLEAGRRIPYRGEPHRIEVVPGSGRRSRILRTGDDDGDILRVERGSADARPVAVILEAWFRARAREAIDAAVAGHAEALGGGPAAITLRDPRTRWGSCSRTGRISLSWRLVLAPPAALEAVVVHELCHLRVFGHGPRFRALLASRCPDHVAARAWLRRHAAELHAALDGARSEGSAPGP